MDEDTSQKQEPTLTFKRDEDFEALYANNVRFEASIWDLKIIFGQLDQSSQPSTVQQHTSVTIPWMQAKAMAYFLEVNLAIYETDHGYIRMPSSIVPQTFDPSTVADAPHLKSTWEYLAALHQRFFPEHQASSDQDKQGP